MNHLQNVHKLKNRYYAMRHGQSKANLQNIIVSHPQNGVHEDYALTELGRQQASASAAESDLASGTIIYASDFSRAQETAEILREALGAAPVHTTELLRERHFGDFEKTDHANYHKVWQHDEADADHSHDNVEPVSAVLDRATGLIAKLEEQYDDQDIVLVSHGDTLQILQAGFQKIDPRKHRSLVHLETAEIRQLTLAE